MGKNPEWKQAEKHIELANEKLRAAKLLLKEGLFGDSISRAYYAMFHAAKAILALKGINTKSHRGLISKFGLEFVNKGYADGLLGKHLSIVEERRESADYDILKDFTEEEASESLEKAQNFVKKITDIIEKIKAGDVRLD